MTKDLFLLYLFLLNLICWIYFVGFLFATAQFSNDLAPVFKYCEHVQDVIPNVDEESCDMIH